MSFGFTQGFHNRNTLGFTTESGDFRLTHENRHKYLVTSKCFFQSILLQDTIIQPNYYLITRYSYSVRKVSYYKILLLFSVSNYYLQDNKIRYCPSLLVTLLFAVAILVKATLPCAQALEYQTLENVGSDVG